MKPIDIDAAAVERLAGLGLTLEEIATSLGFSVATLYTRKRQHVEILEAIKKGRAKMLTDVANALYDKAIGGDVTAMIWFEKTRGGRSDKVAVQTTTVIKGYSLVSPDDWPGA